MKGGALSMEEKYLREINFKTRVWMRMSQSPLPISQGDIYRMSPYNSHYKFGGGEKDEFLKKLSLRRGYCIGRVTVA